MLLALSLVAGLTAVPAVACGDVSNPASPSQGVSGVTSGSSAVALNADDSSAPAVAGGNKAAKVDVSHGTGNGSFYLINVNGNAVPAHVAHGDALPASRCPRCRAFGSTRPAIKWKTLPVAALRGKTLMSYWTRRSRLFLATSKRARG